MTEKHTLKVKGLRYLKDEHGIDLLSGSELDTSNIDTIIAIYVASTAHWKKACTLAMAEDLELPKLMEGVEAVLNSLNVEGKQAKPAGKKAKPRTPKLKR